MLAAAGIAAATAGDARAEPPAGEVGVVIVRGAGRRPTKREVDKFTKALGKALGKSSGWTLARPKAMRRSAELSKKRRRWACSPVEQEEDQGEPSPDAPPPEAEELDCALDFARDAGLERLVVGRIEYERGAYHVALSHLRTDIDRRVHSLKQRIQTKRFKKVLSFAPALARRIMAEHGGFRLVSNVEGADVTMGDLYLGEAPLEQTEMDPGNYKLKVTAMGYFDWKGSVTVEPGLMKTVPVEMELPRMSAPPPELIGDNRPWIFVGIGAAALIGGVAVIASGSSGNRAVGAALGIGGLGILGYAWAYEL